MEKAEQAYIRNFDSKVHRPLIRVQANDWVFLGKEYYNPEKECHPNLSPIVEGPHRVVRVSTDTVVLYINHR